MRLILGMWCRIEMKLTGSNFKILDTRQYRYLVTDAEMNAEESEYKAKALIVQIQRHLKWVEDHRKKNAHKNYWRAQVAELEAGEGE